MIFIREIIKKAFREKHFMYDVIVVGTGNMRHFDDLEMVYSDYTKIKQTGCGSRAGMRSSMNKFLCLSG